MLRVIMNVVGVQHLERHFAQKLYKLCISFKLYNSHAALNMLYRIPSKTKPLIPTLWIFYRRVVHKLPRLQRRPLVPKAR